MTLAQRMLNLATDVFEMPGDKDHPAIQWGFLLTGLDPNTHDEVPWCSAGLNLACRLEGLPRSGKTSARSWLKVGAEVDLAHAQSGDVVVFTRGEGPQPGPEVTNAPGHVAVFLRLVGDGLVEVVGANQSNRITVATFPASRVLGVRRLLAA